MDPATEKECAALTAIFQQIISDMKVGRRVFCVRSMRFQQQSSVNFLQLYRLFICAVPIRPNLRLIPILTLSIGLASRISVYVNVVYRPTG